ncbi:MAG: hypothetical protein R2684_03025 [Pyrinomonadaceae bacterium]
MKQIVCSVFCVLAFSVLGICQCPNNSDGSYDRQKMLEKFDGVLRDSIPAYTKYPSLVDSFFIYDLTDTSNKYVNSRLRKAETCINFVDNHIYHFSVVYFPFSQSHIAVVKDGKLRIFKNINCGDDNDDLEDVISYANGVLKNGGNKHEILTRLKNYRRYGFYLATDEHEVVCNSDKKIPENSDKLYNRDEVLGRFSDVLKNSLSEKALNQLSPFVLFLTEESRANGFFVWDLTEPSNRQISLLERVEFKNNHVYHFAFIDLPFSSSNIAVLEGGTLRIFNAIDCEGKGYSLNDVVTYLNEKLKNDNNRDLIVSRVKNHRQYGVYSSFEGLSKVQCGEVVSAQK